jgi:hypothetical protein
MGRRKKMEQSAIDGAKTKGPLIDASATDANHLATDPSAKVEPKITTEEGAKAIIEGDGPDEGDDEDQDEGEKETEAQEGTKKKPRTTQKDIFMKDAPLRKTTEAKEFIILETQHLKVKYSKETLEDMKGSTDKSLKRRILNKIKFKKDTDPSGVDFDDEAPLILNEIINK